VFWLQLLIMAVWIAARPEYRRYHLFMRFERPRWHRLAELLRIGLPIGTMVFVEGSLFVGAALLIGSLGAVPIASHQIAINFSALCYMVPLGLSGAMTVRVGNALGRGLPREALRASQAGLLMVLVTQSITAALMVFAPAWIIAWYTDDAAIAALAVSLLHLAAVFQFPDGLQAAAAGALRGYKDTRVPMVYTVIAYWLFGMPVGWWLTFRAGWGAPGMWVGMIAGLGSAACLLGLRLWRIGHARLPAER
jgi:MATE family multidrug resistance protein